MIPATSMTKSPAHWREGIFEMVHVAAAVLDFTLSQRDQRAHAFLFHKGQNWVGDPEGGEDCPKFGRLHMAHLRGPNGVSQALDVADDIDAKVRILLVRDQLLYCAHHLLAQDPESLYLLCLYTMEALKTRAWRLSIDIENPDRHSPFSYIKTGKDMCDKLVMVYPNLSHTDDYWEKRLRDALLTV